MTTTFWSTLSAIQKHLFISLNCIGTGKHFADRNFTQRPYLRRRRNLTRLVTSAISCFECCDPCSGLPTDSMNYRKYIMDAMRLEILLMSDKIIIPIMVEFCLLNMLRSQRETSAPASVILFLSVAVEANWSMVL